MAAITTLEQLLAREQIRDLVDRYAVAIDGHQVDDVAALFDPEMDDEKYGKGQDGVRAWYAERLTYGANPSGLHHNVGVHQIDLVDDDHATGFCYMLGAGIDGSDWMQSAGMYVDSYVRRGDRWYFAHRLWAGTGIVRFDTAEQPGAPDAPTPADAWALYREHRAART